MRFDIIITGTKSEALDQHVKRSLSHALDQHDQHMESLDVRLKDINTPKAQTRCRPRRAIASCSGTVGTANSRSAMAGRMPTRHAAKCFVLRGER